MFRSLRSLLAGSFLLSVISVGMAGINEWTFGGLPQGPIVEVAVHPTDPAIAFAGGLRTLFRTTDGGVTFTQLNTSFIMDLKASPTSLQTLLAVVDRASTGWSWLCSRCWPRRVFASHDASRDS
jgi:hypothetical protein